MNSKASEQTKLHQKRLRWIVLTHYGGNPPKCACCGENKYEFLSIEHGKNNPDKRTVKERRSQRIEDWIRHNDFPEGFEVLCHNCNLASGFYGFCPHKYPKKSWKPSHPLKAMKVGNQLRIAQILPDGRVRNAPQTCKQCNKKFLRNVVNTYGYFCSASCRKKYHSIHCVSCGKETMKVDSRKRLKKPICDECRKKYNIKFV